MTGGPGRYGTKGTANALNIPMGRLGHAMQSDRNGASLLLFLFLLLLLDFSSHSIVWMVMRGWVPYRYWYICRCYLCIWWQ
jgi:hypothetical protein